MLDGFLLGFLCRSEMTVVSLATSWSASTNWIRQAVRSEVRVLLVAVRVATVVQSLAVAVARLEMALAVSFW